MKNLLAIGCLFLTNLVFSQNEGDLFHAYSQVHEIRLTFYQTNYWDSLEAGYTGDYYIKGDIEIDGVLMTNCGIKLKGNSSYNNPSIKKSFKLDFNEYVSGQDYDGLKKLNLNNGFKDPTFLREKLMLDFLNENYAYAPRCHFANVYINNTLWGLYTTVEEIDKTFLKNTFDDKKGNLFKGDPSGDLKWLGSTQTNYETKYELKTNETTNNWSDLITFINTLNNTNTAVLDQSLDTIFDFENYSITWAAHNLFANLDSYIGSGHNYYLYFDSTALKFRFITWDVNEAFGNFNQGMSVAQLEQMTYLYASNPPGNRPLTEKSIQNSNYINQYKTRLCDFLNYEFRIQTMEPKIDSLANLIRTSVYADPNKFFTNQNFEDNLENNITVTGNPGGNNIPGLKSFITNRWNSMTGQVSSFCAISTGEITDEQDLLLFPNPATDIIQFTLHEPATVEIINSLGEIIFTQFMNNGNHQLNINNYSQGVYFFMLKNENKNHTFKFSKM